MESTVAAIEAALPRHLVPLLDRLDRIESMLAANAAPAVYLKEYYRTAEAAERLGLRPWTVRQWCNQGRIRAEKVLGSGRAGEWRIAHAELERIQRERSTPLNRKVA